MNKNTILGTALVFLLSGVPLAYSFGEGDNQVEADVEKILKMSHREESDKARDWNREPARALAFFGLRKNMKVIEFAPGDGWYTKVLAPLLRDDGELYLAYKKEWLNHLDPILKKKRLRKAKKLPIALDWDPKNYKYTLGEIDFGMTDADMFLSIREYHNFFQEEKDRLNKAVFESLKPGGAYVIVDHTRRHMQPEVHELRRREDPVQVILDVQAAGFVLEKSSDMFFKSDDELRYEVGRKTVTGNTDRFTFVFRKPASS